MLITPRPLICKKRQFWEGRGVVFTYAAAAGRKSTSLDGMDFPLAAIAVCPAIYSLRPQRTQLGGRAPSTL